MSGIDEIPSDIPICPRCNERPLYWTLHKNGRAIVWLYSGGYRHSDKLKFYGEYFGGEVSEDTRFDTAYCLGGCNSAIRFRDSDEKIRRFAEAIHLVFRRRFPEQMREY